MLLEHLYDQFKKGDSTLLKHLYSTFRQPFVTHLIDKYACNFDYAIVLYQTSILILYDELVQGSLPNQKIPVISYLLEVAEDSWDEYTSYLKIVGIDSTFDHLHLVDRAKRMHRSLKVETLMAAILQMNDPHRKYLETRYFQDPDADRMPYVPGNQGGDLTTDLMYESISQLLKIYSEGRST